jgi:hypothetical protein
MERKIASEIADLYHEFGDWFSRMTEASMRVADVEEAKELRRGLGKMNEALHDAVWEPLHTEYPELFPDNL